jgi:hypothetical protein
MTLEVGTVIYDNRINRYVISRVTKCRAYCKIGDTYEKTFKREVLDAECFRRIGSSGWGTEYYSIETPELIKKHNRKIREYRFIKIDVLKLTDEQLSKILDIAKGEES